MVEPQLSGEIVAAWRSSARRGGDRERLESLQSGIWSTLKRLDLNHSPASQRYTA